MPVAQPRRAPKKAEQAGDRVLHFAQILVGVERARDGQLQPVHRAVRRPQRLDCCRLKKCGDIAIAGGRGRPGPMTDAPSAVKEATRPRGRLDSAKASEMASEMSWAVNPGSSLYAKVAVFASEGRRQVGNESAQVPALFVHREAQARRRARARRQGRAP